MNARGLPVLAAVFLASCRQDASLIEGHASVEGVSYWVLTSEQLRIAERWLRVHRPNCLAGVASPPSTDMMVTLQRANGSKLELGFFPQPGWAGSVVARIGKDFCDFHGTNAEVAEFRRSLAAGDG